MNHKKTIQKLSEEYGVIDLLTAAIMRNNNLSYNEASDIALRLNSSDYIFDRLIDEFIEEEQNEDEMINTVHKVITKGDAICFIINTRGGNDFWYWEIERYTWNLYWEDKNPACITENIMEWAANEFVNSDECSHCGYSCSGFETVEDAIEDYLTE